MILDLGRFVQRNRLQWAELEHLLNRVEAVDAKVLTFEEARRLHYLYERCSADLARISTFSSDPQTRAYLSSLVGRAYAVIYETRKRSAGVSALRWIWRTFPQTFRRQLAAFWLAVALTLGGSVFGAVAILWDPGAKQVLMPFSGLNGSPADRVKQEEKGPNVGLQGHRGTFSAQLITHNTRVSIFTLALGMTWGFGPALLLFYNGVILGAVAFDYIRAGYTIFLLGWLLPHGVIEIPAILVAGQAGFVLAGALIGQSSRKPRRTRLREAAPDVATLAAGAALFLVWAGLVESFISQWHQPVLPYALKIGFGLVEFALLYSYLSFAGRGEEAK